jgi:hypothetical protein
MNKRKQGTATRVTRRGRAAKTPGADTEHKTGNGAFSIAAECTVADAAGLQVIATFVRERETHGRPVEWRGNAPALSAAAKLLGLSSFLKLS